MKYDAFISYSHHGDGRLAPELQDGLRRLAKPWSRLQALRVFRDDTGLSVTPALWTSIAEALSGSKYFILLASPEAAASEWVDREIRYWLEHKGAERLLPVVTGGEWVWDEARNDLDPALSTAAPPALYGAFAEEPRFLDLRWTHDAESLSLRNGRFRDAVADLAAPIHGKPKDELDGEDIRQHRKTVRLRRSAIAGLGALAVATTVGGLLAAWSREEAVNQRAVAEQRARLTQAQRLNTESRALLDQSRPLDALVAALHALQATRIDGTYVTGAETRLYQALDRLPEEASAGRLVLKSSLRGGAGDGGLIPAVAASDDGCRVAATVIGGGTQVWDRCRDRSLADAVAHVQEGGEADDEPWTAVRAGSGSTISLALSPSGDRIALAGADGSLTLYPLDPASSADVVRWSGDAALTAVAFSPDGRWLATGGASGTVHLHDSRSEGGSPRVLSEGVGQPVTSVAFGGEGPRLAAAGLDSRVLVWDSVASGLPARPLDGQGAPAYAVALSPDGRLLATGGRDGVVRLWEGGGEAGEPRHLESNAGAVTAVAFGREGRWLAAALDDGDIRVWDGWDLTLPPRELVGHHRLVSSLVAGRDGGGLVSGSYDGTVRLWPLAFDDLHRAACQWLPWAFAAAGEEPSVASLAGPGGTDLSSLSANCFQPLVDDARRLAELSSVLVPGDEWLEAAEAAFRFASVLDPRGDLIPDTPTVDRDPAAAALALASAARRLNAPR